MKHYFFIHLPYTITMRFLITISTLFLLLSCSNNVKFNIEGKLVNNAASMVYLVVDGQQVDTLASAPIASDNSFRLRGEVHEPTTAFICDDNGNTLTILLTENATLRLRPLAEGGYIAEGGPINDKYNLTMSRMSDIARQIIKLDPDDQTVNEQYESLAAKYHQILSTAITDNLDNLVGVELFLSQESRSMTAEDMRVRLAQFSPQMRELSVMRQFAEYIELYARSEVGKQITDISLNTLTGHKFLSEIRQGKWVLLDFWATWCEPCLEEIPTLQKAYEKYAIRGFEICAISLDMDAERWRKFISENNLLWTNAIDLPNEDEPTIADIYGLQSIPTNLLISPQGEIVARNIFGEELLHELQHHLGE